MEGLNLQPGTCSYKSSCQSENCKHGQEAGRTRKRLETCPGTLWVLLRSLPQFPKRRHPPKCSTSFLWLFALLGARTLRTGLLASLRTAKDATRNKDVWGQLWLLFWLSTQPRCITGLWKRPAPGAPMTGEGCKLEANWK